METNLPNFDLEFGYLFPPEPEEIKQKKGARWMKNTTRRNSA